MSNAQDGLAALFTGCWDRNVNVELTDRSLCAKHLNSEYQHTTFDRNSAIAAEALMNNVGWDRL